MRRYLYALACGLGATAAHGQAVADSLVADTTQYQPGISTCWVESATDSAGVCTEVMRWAGPGGLVRSFYPSGHLKDYMPYANLATNQPHGVATTWYDDGQLSIRQTFLQGRRDSTLLLYYPNGQLKRQTHYVAAHELPGLCYDLEGQPIPYFPYEQPPLYPGGQAQLVKEINRAIVRQLPLGTHLVNEGELTISFQVNEDGSIGLPQVVVTTRKMYWAPTGQRLPAGQSLQELLDRECDFLHQKALRALAIISRPFRPGLRDGQVVPWRYRLVIPFNYAVG